MSFSNWFKNEQIQKGHTCCYQHFLRSHHELSSVTCFINQFSFVLCGNDANECFAKVSPNLCQVMHDPTHGCWYHRAHALKSSKFPQFRIGFWKGRLTCAQSPSACELICFHETMGLKAKSLATDKAPTTSSTILLAPQAKHMPDQPCPNVF